MLIFISYLWVNTENELGFFMERGLMRRKLGNFAYLEDFDNSYFSSNFDMVYVFFSYEFIG